MKVYAAVVACLLLCQCMASPAVHFQRLKLNQKFRVASKDTMNLLKEESPRADGKVDLCPTCIQFTDQAIDNLLNIILQIGVVGTCGQLCGMLQNKTGSGALGLVCNLLCDYVGVQEFVKLIQQADLDPFYFCELIKICPIFDGGDAKITRLAVSPNSGPQGKFLIELSYTSKNGTGVGEMIVAIDTVDGIPIESGYILGMQLPTSYNSTITLKARPDPNCDPMQQPCEMWLPGVYNVEVALCYGECGSKHPHSQVYDKATANFTITEN